MTTADLRALGQEIVQTCDALDEATAANESLQSQLDTANAAAVTDKASIASLQAALDALRATPPAAVADLHEFSDFAVQRTGQFLAGDLAGKGSQLTTYRMKAASNTKPADVQLALMRAGWAGQVVNLSGFTLEGTDQAGVEYQGLMSKGGAGSKITDVTVTGIPGHGSAPTSTGGETFALSLLRNGSHTLSNVNLDGRRGGAGVGVSATLFGTNYSTGDVVWIGGRANYAVGGFAHALFQASGSHTFIGLDLRNNRKLINIEQSLACTYRYIRCDLRGATGAAYIAQISSLGLGVSAKVIFEDCLFDNDQCVVNTYTTAANGGQNGQKDADIQRIDNGVDVTATPAKFKLTHV